MEVLMRELPKFHWALWLLPIAWAGCSDANSSKMSSAPATHPVAAVAKTPASEAAGAVAEKPKAAEEPTETLEIAANLAKLSPEDRKLAEEQKVCVESDEPLGAMGVPIKIMVKDQPVFLCCPACKKAALKDPDKTLAKLEKIKSESKKPEK
jgi:hypothetical protein